MTDLKVVLQQYQESERALRDAIRENGETFINALFQSIFDKYPTVSKLCTIGSTPYFNDGDICSHSSEYFSGVWHTSSYGTPGTKYYDYEDYSVAEEFFTGESDEDEDDDFEDEEGRTYTPEKVAEIAAPTEEELLAANVEAKGAKDMMEEFDTIFERMYDTNYIVKATRFIDGTIEVENDEYDPGY